MIPLWFYWVLLKSGCHWRNAHKYASGVWQASHRDGCPPHPRGSPSCRWIPHLRDTAHTVVGVRNLAAVGLRHLRLIVDQVIVVGGSSAVRIGDGGLVAHAVVGVLYPLAGVIRGSGQLMQQVQLKDEGKRSICRSPATQTISSQNSGTFLP